MYNVIVQSTLPLTLTTLRQRKKKRKPEKTECEKIKNVKDMNDDERQDYGPSPSVWMCPLVSGICVRPSK
jgi:hypothetical protein